jgi:hypothetical protein
MEQIDKWEKEAIDKIRQAAQDAREQVNKLTGSQKGKLT